MGSLMTTQEQSIGEMLRRDSRPAVSGTLRHRDPARRRPRQMAGRSMGGGRGSRAAPRVGAGGSGWFRRRGGGRFVAAESRRRACRARAARRDDAGKPAAGQRRPGHSRRPAEHRPGARWRKRDADPGRRRLACFRNPDPHPLGARREPSGGPGGRSGGVGRSRRLVNRTRGKRRARTQRHRAARRISHRRWPDKGDGPRPDRDRRGDADPSKSPAP